MVQGKEINEPGLMRNVGYGPHPAAQVLTTLVLRPTRGWTDGVNEPVPAQEVPEVAGRTMLSNGLPETM